MVYFHLTWMEWLPFAFANVWQIECTDCSLESNNFFS